MRSEDDLTYKLGEIIKSSTNVRKSEQEGSPAHIVTEYEQLLQVCMIPCVILTITVDTQHSSTLQPIWTTTSRVSPRRCKSQVVL
jgi:DNA-directed RNA polymerase beta' subunit